MTLFDDLFTDTPPPTTTAPAATETPPVETPEPAADTKSESATAPEKPKRGRPRKAASTNGGILYFDLETVPDWGRLDQFGIETPPVVAVEDCLSPEEFCSQTLKDIEEWLDCRQPPSEWLDAVEKYENEQAKKPRAGLLKAIEACRGREAALRKTLSVTPEFCRVCAVGFAVGDGPIQHRVFQPADGVEKNALDELWANFKAAKQLCGYNVLGFDLPVIFTRSALLGVTPQRRLDLKPWGKDVIDLMACRYPKGQARSLKATAAALGIEIPAGDVDGADVETLLKTDVDKLAEYVCSDVAVTRDLHRLWSGTFCD